MMVMTRESLDLGEGTMSFAIVLGGWAAASILLSPLIGRFLSVQDESNCRGEARHIDAAKPSRRSRHGGNAGMRRNVTIQLNRREAGWPRAG
jgi:hypothetical protein